MKLQNLPSVMVPTGEVPQVLDDLVSMVGKPRAIERGRRDDSIPSPHISRVILHSNSITVHQLVVNSGGYRAGMKPDKRQIERGVRENPLQFLGG
jgi:hypothetical protein